MGDTPKFGAWQRRDTLAVCLRFCRLMGAGSTAWPPVIAIVGPTAVGKTHLALELAHELGAAIISADSRQVYRYLDIGTDKSTLTERGRVPHYLLDVVQPSEVYSAQRFQEEATRVLHRIRFEGKPVFVVGGTGYYIRALLDRERFPSIPPNGTLRAELRQAVLESGPESIHERLARRDARSASRIHPNNLSRVIRAIEIVEATGKPVGPVDRGPQIPALYLGLRRDRADLGAAADRRVDQQLSLGLVEETRTVLAMGYDHSAPGLQGFGYRDMVTYLRGESTLQTATERYKLSTHAYIRRQLTWFRADDRIEWMDHGPGAVLTARERIAAWLESSATKPPVLNGQ